ncbi:MAG: rhodanese-like domain-containing protein [Candidatus Sericytochromatia bacterium]
MSTLTCEKCSVSDLKNLLEKNDESALFIDVRTKGEYKSSYISGVKNIPLDELRKNLDEIKKYEKVYIHCHNGTRTEEACKKLSKEGIKTVYVSGGLVAWKKSGYPVASSTGGKEVISIIRQVQITAGSLVIIGYLLSQFVNPNFIFLSVAIGAGLLFTGISGNCLMAKMLGVLPWNK